MHTVLVLVHCKVGSRLHTVIHELSCDWREVLVVSDGFKAAAAQHTEVWVRLLHLHLQLRLKVSALVQHAHQTFEQGHDLDKSDITEFCRGMPSSERYSFGPTKT